MMELKTLRYGNYPRLSRESLNVITRALIRGGRGRWDDRRGEGEVMAGAETGAAWCENGRRTMNQGMGRPLEAEKSRDLILPWGLQKKPALLSPRL